MDQHASEAPIRVAALRKAFHGQAVLRGIDLTVAHGETLAVLGRSGTGKSVLLKLLMGLQPPDAGSICVFGQEITRLPLDQLNEVRKRVGFLFQQSALYDSLTVEGNVAFPLDRHVRLSRAERNERVRELLSRVGMVQDRAKLPSELSGGMQKRVGLARALALDPDLLLCDEPTAGLDPITAREIAELLVRLREERNITSIIVTHDIPGAKAFAHRLALLHDGAIRAEGTARQLRESRDDFVVQFFQDAA